MSSEKPTNNNDSIIKPELLGGFRDLLPAEALMTQKVVDTIRKVYESFGFVPLETPGMENRKVLLGNTDNFNKSIFLARIVRGIEDKKIANDSWDQDYTLRFDLTVPLARVIAAYPDLPKPFKRYQIGKVWRGERPQAGRYREFSQFDFDIIGSNSILADIEVIQVMYQSMKALGIDNFLIRFNTRKILNGLAEAVNCLDNSKELFRIIDKLDKIGLTGVKSELMRQPANEYDDTALAMTENKAEKVIAFLQIKSESSDDVLVKLQDFFGDSDDLGQSGLYELQKISKALTDLNIPQKNWKIDLSVARGLDYYTGPVFETTLTDIPEIGSVFSGGRFDGLTNRFIAGSNIAGVGASVGIDRLIVALQKLGLIDKRDSVTDVLVTIFDPELQKYSMDMVQELQQNGYNTELYLGDDYTFRAQFSYAAKKSIPFVVIIGPEEMASGKIQLKDMNARKQELLTKEECFANLKSSLGK
ncbi:histidine--tRNA ligase [Candidatus Falkowbacteria bacterium]|uniref:Histidine--tRNA ligase n=1 Tax=Candidatus Buchananbacteria bacterium CG10_big_fil_rev_8_21_14_0_10_33_19 TaxID=1974525 RepID=A0A2H0W6X2_9BACT|nr:histidine--tRNA ligase [Candidatus Falkowbacteria bacterium]PIS06341.1 MAG: histidine--tRNA ligase [Candidatus Buchananbacteria bacterium CG10_big_fil_rev_8_21_14_0_10_33_19]